MSPGPPRIVREGVFIGLGQAAAALAGLVGVRLLTSLLPPAVYGELVLLLGLAVLGSGLLCYPFLQGLLRYYPEARSAGRVGALRGLTRHFLTLGVAGASVLLLAAGALRSTPLAFVAVAAMIAMDAWRTFELDLLNGARRHRDYMVRIALDGWAKWLAGAAMAWALGPRALHALTGFALGSGAVGLLLRRRIEAGKDDSRRWSGDPWAVERRPAFLAYALPLVPLAALNWTMSLGDRYLLAGLWSVSTAGIYAAAYGIASQPFVSVGGIVQSTLRPVLYDAVARGDAVKERRTLRVWIAVVVVLMASGWGAMTLLARPLCALFLGPAFQGAVALLPWIAAAYALQSVQQTFETILYARAGTRRLFALQVLAAATSVVLYLLLIPRYGARGAAMATLGTFVVTTTAAFFLADAPRRLGLRTAD